MLYQLSYARIFLGFNRNKFRLKAVRGIRTLDLILTKDVRYPCAMTANCFNAASLTFIGCR